MKKYDYPFERLKHILGDDFHSPAEKEKMAKKKKEEEEAAKKKLDVIEEEEEPMIKEITDEEEAKINDDKNQIIESKV